MNRSQCEKCGSDNVVIVHRYRSVRDKTVTVRCKDCNWEEVYGQEERPQDLS